MSTMRDATNFAATTTGTNHRDAGTNHAATTTTTPTTTATSTKARPRLVRQLLRFLEQ